jgi:UDP-galactopyranose mutase
MRRLAERGHAVHWVEPRYLRWLAKRPADFWRARRERPVPGLTVRPMTLVNGERLPFIQAHNRYWLARALRSANQETSGGSIQPRVLWLYDPHHFYLADRVPHDLLIYDIMDEFGGFPWSPPGVAEEEAALLARADWVFAGTGALYDAKRPMAEGRIEMILSGVEAKRLAEPVAEAQWPAAARAMHGQFRRLAGYAGMIDLRVDQDLLRAAAQALPDWGFALAGPVHCDARALESLPNVRLLGALPYEQLPAFYHSLDVALLPFVENSLTRHVNPTKMLEYAAAGRPIVARALPDVERFYADGAWLYRDAEGFLAALRAIDVAIGAGPPEALAPRLEHARAWVAGRDWDAVADRMLGRVEALLERKRATR